MPQTDTSLLLSSPYRSNHTFTLLHLRSTACILLRITVIIYCKNRKLLKM